MKRAGCQLPERRAIQNCFPLVRVGPFHPFPGILYAYGARNVVERYQC